jgi:regulatory protein
MTKMPVHKPENREIVSAALRLLARRDMSRTEFLTKLGKSSNGDGSDFSPEDLEVVTEWCAQEGFLNETRFAEGKARTLGARYGARRVGATLKQKGVGEELIAETIAQLADSDFDRARVLWLRKFGEPASSANEKNKQIRFLQSRGFGFDVIKKVISGVEADD